MFDIGFFELLVIGAVGLFVIGPERLPHTIRTCALWIGRVKRSVLDTRREIEQQLGADEIRRELQNEQVMRNLEKMKDTRAELEMKIRNLGTGVYQGQEAEAKTAVIESTDHSREDATAAADKVPNNETPNAHAASSDASQPPKQ